MPSVAKERWALEGVEKVAAIAFGIGVGLQPHEKAGKIKGL